MSRSKNVIIQMAYDRICSISIGVGHRASALWLHLLSSLIYPR